VFQEQYNRLQGRVIKIRKEKADVLIIGSGGAGLRAAIELKDNNVDVLVVGKCKKRDAHTVLATGGINAALGTMDTQDSWTLHAADTIKDGGYLNNPEAVKTLCKNAPYAVKELADWGVKFHKEKNGKISQRFFGAATYRRACFVGDHTGREILNVLVDQTLTRNIRLKGEIYIFSLLMSKGKVNGALGLDMRKGEIIAFNSRIVVLAAGGHSRMFGRSSSRFWENNGDGIALAYGVGAACMDMELFQFHPTGMVWPKQVAGVLVTEAIRGEGGRLTNAKGERFMKNYDPERMELSARDVVARAIYHEVKQGRGTKRGGVWLDISHKPKPYILKRLPMMYKQFKKYAHIDISKEKMEVAPTAHYSMGGIYVDHTTGKTGVKNLYAIGEVTAGVHGGNRLGGNSLAEITVFGRLTGQQIVKDLKKTKRIPLDETLMKKKEKEFYKRLCATGKDALVVKTEIQQLMWKHVSVARNEKQMKAGLKKLQTYKKLQLKTGHKLRMNEHLLAALDVSNMLPTCEMIMKCALLRKESRAAHFRTDYKETKKSWEKNIIATPTGRGFRLTTKKVGRIPLEIKKQLKKKRKPMRLHLLE